MNSEATCNRCFHFAWTATIGCRGYRTPSIIRTPSSTNWPRGRSAPITASRRTYSKSCMRSEDVTSSSPASAACSRRPTAGSRASGVDRGHCQPVAANGSDRVRQHGTRRGRWAGRVGRVVEVVGELMTEVDGLYPPRFPLQRFPATSNCGEWERVRGTQKRRPSRKPLMRKTGLNVEKPDDTLPGCDDRCQAASIDEAKARGHSMTIRNIGDRFVWNW